jgi:hypothetical protein|tara:strand:+ start:344 stop:541 length:198 start_codon:yes stop_codon:yes gene_type:complete
MKIKNPQFDWGVFIEWYDDNGQTYEIIIPESLAIKVHSSIQALLKGDKRSKSKRLDPDTKGLIIW